MPTGIVIVHVNSIEQRNRKGMTLPHYPRILLEMKEGKYVSTNKTQILLCVLRKNYFYFQYKTTLKIEQL
jgi:hypothetical protein